jgi:hypothetical protein
MRSVHYCLLLSAVVLGCLEAWAAETPFAWQRDYARVTQGGDIEWTPNPFRFNVGSSVRYVDYMEGADDNEGTSKQRPWKHHPWDVNATGIAAAAVGIDTYVFKGGVVYRGQLTVKEQGRPDSPIRLTHDPDWGDGPAIIAGSEQVRSWSKGADHPNIPEPEAVWMATLDFTPRTLWMIGRDRRATRIPLARHPNWMSQPEDHKAQWFSWTNTPHPFQAKEGFSANDYINLKDLAPDFVQDALIYSEFGWVMGTPYPTRVNNYDPTDGSVRFAGWTGGGNASVIFRGMRYYLEDKPQYLDDATGEFWFDRKGTGGVLYARLPGGIDPNTVRMEAGKRTDLILGSDAKHIEISGLEFRWTTQAWNLDTAHWDFNTKPFGTRPEAEPACIHIRGKGEDIRIANCVFEDVVSGIYLRALGKDSPMRGITIENNVFRNADVGHPRRRAPLPELRRQHRIPSLPLRAGLHLRPHGSLPGAHRRQRDRALRRPGNQRPCGQGRYPRRGAPGACAHPAKQGLEDHAERQRLRRHRKLAARAGVHLQQPEFRSPGPAGRPPCGQ